MKNYIEFLKEEINPIDPYGEENWGVMKKVNDVYVIYVGSQDSNFLCKKKWKIVDERREWRVYYYEMAKFNNGIVTFDSECTINSMSAYEVDKKDSVLDGTELVGCIVGLGRIKMDTLQNLCDLAEIDIDSVKLYNGYN